MYKHGAGEEVEKLRVLCFALQDDVGSISVCCEYALLTLVNKEGSLAYGTEEYSQPGRKRERVGGVKEMPCNCQRRKMLEPYWEATIFW